MVVDDVVRAVVCLAERASDGENVAALVLRDRLLLLLLQALLAAAVKTFQQLRSVFNR